MFVWAPVLFSLRNSGSSHPTNMCYSFSDVFFITRQGLDPYDAVPHSLISVKGVVRGRHLDFMQDDEYKNVLDALSD